MTLRELLKELSLGELSNLAVGIEGYGLIRDDKIPNVVSMVNEALLRLYSKFILKKNILYLELNEHTTEYHLDSKHAYSNPESIDKYVQDSFDHPFKDDLIKVLDVMTYSGKHLPLNNRTEEWSVYTPSFNVLQISYPRWGQVLTVVYQARHPTLYPDQLDDEVDCPDVLLGALKAYVAQLYYGNMNTQDAVANAQKYSNIYNTIIADVLAQDLVSVTYSQTSSKFHKNGFV